MSTPEFTQPNNTLQTGSTYKNNIEAAIAAIGNGMPCRNLGVTYSGGTFTVTGANGTALSASNPAFVTFQSKANPGRLLTCSVEADQSFIDDAGASEIVGCLFGFSTGVAITVDVPFFIYAALADDGTTVSFALSRVPHHVVVPAVGLLGTPASAIADTQASMFFFDSVTVANYDGNPCVALGSVRARMSASDDWTIQTLATTDGIGQFQESTLFTVPLGQFGAVASTITLNNGGTAPVFTTTNAEYTISRDGTCIYEYYVDSDGGTDGAGAVTATMTTPYIAEGTNSFVHLAQMRYAAGTTLIAQGSLLTTSNGVTWRITGSTKAGAVQWSAFTAGDRRIFGAATYKVDIGI